MHNAVIVWHGYTQIIFVIALKHFMLLLLLPLVVGTICAKNRKTSYSVVDNIKADDEDVVVSFSFFTWKSNIN